MQTIGEVIKYFHATQSQCFDPSPPNSTKRYLLEIYLFFIKQNLKKRFSHLYMHTIGPGTQHQNMFIIGELIKYIHTTPTYAYHRGTYQTLTHHTYICPP